MFIRETWGRFRLIWILESIASCTSLSSQSSDNTELSFTPLTALRFHSKDTQTLRFSLHRQSAPRLRGKTEHMSPPVAEGLPKKLPKLQIYTSLPCASEGSVWTQAIQILTSAVSLILLHLRKNEDCFPKRQTSFVISSSFFSSYVSEIPNFPPKWRPRVGRKSRDSRPYPWPPNHGTELPFSSGLGRWDFTLS